MEYLYFTFKWYENLERLSPLDEVLKFRRLLFASVSRSPKFGNSKGVNLETKIENGSNTVKLEFPKEKEIVIKEVLEYINKEFCEINYEVSKTQ